MASPLLEAGAIDGARGILINITGSSALKLSEVNEASSLIQSAAHEDANIIFGAVQDEKMGDEVKVTVIATGFRDQMPERRARMLSVEETPVVSVPVLAPGNWMREPEPEPEPAAKPARFMSEDEEAAESADDAFFVATKVSVAVPLTKTVADHAKEFGMPESTVAQAEQRLDAVEGESQYASPPRDYLADFNEVARGGPDDPAEPGAQAEPSLFPEPSGEQERDLDVPTFLRRLKF
jgi:cell division protein FtsZ